MKHFNKQHTILITPKRGNFQYSQIKFGVYALQALESGILTSSQLESVRRTISRLTSRTSKSWVRVHVNTPVTAKPREIRMGKGKGDVAQYVRYITRGQILFEIAAGLNNKKILFAAKYKLPILTRIIEKF